MDRREFLRVCTIGAAGVGLSGRAHARSKPDRSAPRRVAGLRLLAFDGFPLFDPRPVLAEVARVVGPENVPLWKERLFSYQWLRALGGRYRDFLEISDDALRFVASSEGLSLDPAGIEAVRGALLSLQAWPDARAGLLALKMRGLRIALLSNMTPEMLENGVRANDLGPLVDDLISTDAARTFKPDPTAYGLAETVTGIPPERTGFVAFAGWDAAGASWFGFETFWMNRIGAPAESMPDAPLLGVGKTMNDLIQFADGFGASGG